MLIARRGVVLFVALGLWVVNGLCHAAVPSSDAILPKTTVGYVSVPSYDLLKDHWNKTQLGKLMAEPAMKDFEHDFRDSIQSQWSSATDRMGIVLDDLKGVASGETGFAMLEPKPGEAAFAMIMNVGGGAEKALAVIAKARATLTAKGARESAQTIGGAKVVVFDLPQPPGATGPAERTIYFISQDVFGSCDNLEVVGDMLARLNGTSQAGSLATLPGYRMVMKRCETDAPGKTPLIRWYMHPLGYAGAVRAATPAEKRRRGKTVLEIMRHQGFAAIQGMGGYLNLADDGYEIIHRTAIYAPPPYTNGMKMLLLPNVNKFTPQPWVPREIATYTTLYIDILNAFDNFDSLYDEMVGEEGVWKQTLKGMKTDPYGPKLDLREELIKNLGQRITMVSDYQTPITTTSERLLWAIEVKDEAAVAKAIEKSVKNDPTMKRREIGGHIVWEVVEEQEAAVPSISLDVPSLTPKTDKKESLEKKDDSKDDDDKEPHFLPHGAITVAKGELFIASHIDILKKVLVPAESAKLLRDDKGFLAVWSLFDKKLGLAEQCAREFSWTDEELRPTYELIKQGKMPQSESLLGRTLNTFSGAAKRGKFRDQRIKGGNLPDFDKVVRAALGSAAIGVSSEPTGWFLKGVLLPK